MSKVIVKPFLIKRHDPLYQMELYCSDDVGFFIQSFDQVEDNGNTVNEVFKKLKYLARRGFDVDGKNIKYYKEYKVFRISVHSGNKEGRIIGFKANSKFIAISSFYKNKPKPDREQIQIIEKVAKICRDKHWIEGI